MPQQILNVGLLGYACHAKRRVRTDLRKDVPNMLKRLFDLQPVIDRLYATLFERSLADGWTAAWPLDDL